MFLAIGHMKSKTVMETQILRPVKYMTFCTILLHARAVLIAPLRAAKRRPEIHLNSQTHNIPPLSLYTIIFPFFLSAYLVVLPVRVAAPKG